MIYKTKVSIIIISTNEAHFLDNCLSSIFLSSLDKNKYEVILINNNSSDNTDLLVRKKYPQVKIFHRKKRFGFSANNNYGIKRSSGKYVLLLNADTMCQKQSIQTLLKFMENHPNVGVCGPKLIYPDGSLQLSCRKFPTLWSGILRRSPLRMTLPSTMRAKQHLNISIDHNKIQKVDWLLGACIMISKKAIKKIGLLDEKYFLYVDDIDYCWRAWNSDWQVYYVPTSTIVHYHQAESDRKLFSIHSKYHIKSMLHFLWKHKYFFKKNFYITKNYT